MEIGVHSHILSNLRYKQYINAFFATELKTIVWQSNNAKLCAFFPNIIFLKNSFNVTFSTTGFFRFSDYNDLGCKRIYFCVSLPIS